MTKNTHNPTAERLREMVANLIPLDLIHDRQRPGQPQDAFEAADRIIATLRTHGLLSDGTPSEGQAEGSARVGVHPPTGHVWVERGGSVLAHVYDKADAEEIVVALTAAGAAPQEPKQNETKSGQDFVSLDPEKVAEIIWDYVDVTHERQELLTRALCEAAKRGELS